MIIDRIYKRNADCTRCHTYTLLLWRQAGTEDFLCDECEREVKQ